MFLGKEMLEWELCHGTIDVYLVSFRRIIVRQLGGRPWVGRLWVGNPGWSCKSPSCEKAVKRSVVRRGGNQKAAITPGRDERVIEAGSTREAEGLY